MSFTDDQLRRLVDCISAPLDPYPMKECPRCKGRGDVWCGPYVGTEVCDECGGGGELPDRDEVDRQELAQARAALMEIERGIRERYARIAECEYQRGDTLRACRGLVGYGGFTLAAERIARAIRAEDRATHASPSWRDDDE